MFSVKLTSFDASKKIALIKEIKNLIPGTNLVQVKKNCDNFPIQENMWYRHTRSFFLRMSVFKPLKAVYEASIALLSIC